MFLTPNKGKWLLAVCHLTMKIFCFLRYNQVPSENSFAKYVECCMKGIAKNPRSTEILGNTEMPSNSLGKIFYLGKPWVLILIKLHSPQKVVPRCLMTLNCPVLSSLCCAATRPLHTGDGEKLKGIARVEGNALETPEITVLLLSRLSQRNVRPCHCYPAVTEAVLYPCLLWILPAVTSEAQR